MVHALLRRCCRKAEPDAGRGAAARAIVVCVQWQVFGRYVLNDTPDLGRGAGAAAGAVRDPLGVAVGVRDAGHIGLESLVALLPEHWRAQAGDR